MKWTILDTDRSPQDPSGVEGFIQRMDQELRGNGSPLEGFRFLNSGPEMLRITREIENESLHNPADSSTLYVGFQTAEKLHRETSRYLRIRESGVSVVGFGQGKVTAESSGNLAQWVDLSKDNYAFENQWYLVTKEPTPIAFIGWETSEDSAMFGQGGISTPGKQFRGFVSNDERIVDAVIGHLERVRKQFGPSQAMSLEELTREIPFPVQRMMVVTDRGRNSEVAALRDAAGKFAAEKSAYLMLYDLSAVSYLVNPYPSAEVEKEWHRPLHQKELSMIGRGYLVDQINTLDKQGACAGAILPTEHGFGHLAQWAEQEQADLILVPSHLAGLSPADRIKDHTLKNGTVAGAFFSVGTLLDRIKGYTLKKLMENTSIPVVVYEPSGLAWMRTQASGSNADSGSQSGATTSEAVAVA